MDRAFIRSEHTRAGLIAGRVRLCGTLLFVGSFLIGFLLFVAMILPTLENSGYVETVCNRTDFTVSKLHDMKCNCLPEDGSSKCVIHYPCLQLFATYNVRGRTQRALVVKCRRHVGDKCSYTINDYDCISEKSVYGQLKGFRDRFAGLGKSSTCYVKADQPNYAVLIRKRLEKHRIVNVILWPCLGIMVGMIMMISSKILSSYYCNHYIYHRADDMEPLATYTDS